ncbi:MAG: oligopeptide transport system permease protein [Rhodothermales bacterium]|jgi:oligopeptide transport system permease protein
MLRYTLIRLVQAPIVLFLLVTITFFLIRFAPGGPFSGEKNLPPEVEAALEAKYQLDKPLPVQYFRFMGRLLHGDLGPSLKHKDRTVNEIIGSHLPTSMLLGGIAMSLALAMGLGAGIVAALRQNTAVDYSVMTVAVLGISLPTFVIGPLLQIFLAMRTQIFPVAQYHGLSSPSYLVLPAVTLALPFAARIARLMRAGMLDVLGQDFVRTARAKGLHEHTVVLRHALRGGILPVISYLGPAIAAITTGSLVVEKIFQIPGLGSEFVESALNRDYFLVIGTVIVYGLFIVLCNLIADLAYGILDPRVSYHD